MEWPLDYVQIFAERQKRLLNLRANPHLWVGAKEFYRTRPLEWINHWAVTFDPRNAGSGLPTIMPFITFERQDDLVMFLLACLEGEASGLIEKCRDMGATWVCAAFSVWLWLYWPGAAVGWGSRKEQLVDKLGDPDSIFEKMRMIIKYLPREMLPVGFNPNVHQTYMKFINPENSATITGEAGDNIGRGGRKSIYFKDESAHYERPEKIEAALGDNTRVQIDISSVNGLGNIFHRRREAGVEWTRGAEVQKVAANVFIMDWSDHPAKTQAWYDERRAKAVADGLLHIFEQEVNRNYSAAVDGIVIPFEWVRAAIDAHLALGFDDEGMWVAALDVADGGGDLNALALRKGVVLRAVEDWGERDTGNTTRRAIGACNACAPVTIQYDCIGVGSGVKAEVNRLTDENAMPWGIEFEPWDAGAGPLNPEDRVIPDDERTPLNKDFYTNIKAQGWWQLRLRFERTWRAINEPGYTWNAEDLISIDSTIPLLRKLEKELSQATYGQGARMKMLINKAPEGTRSPNLADAVMMCYWPVNAGTDLNLWAKLAA